MVYNNLAFLKMAIGYFVTF